LLLQQPQDGLYQHYAERLSGYLAQSPPDDWDGVTIFDSK